MEPLTDEDLNAIVEERILLNAEGQPFHADPDILRLVTEIHRQRQEMTAISGGPLSGAQHLPLNVLKEHCKECPLFRAWRLRNQL
jgi:hypothetical protein